MSALSKSQVADICLLLPRGDRRVDCQIGVAIGAFARRRKPRSGRLDYVDIRTPGHENWPGYGGNQLVPGYTSSLDLAMSLAVPTHYIHLINEMPAGWIVKIGSRSNDREPVVDVEGVHLPAVLCAAWLRVGEP